MGRASTAGPLVFTSGNVDSGAVLRQAALGISIRIASAFAFHVIPGLVLLAKGPAWADLLVPDTGSGASHIEYPVLLSIGLVLLGYYFIVSGLAGAVGGAVSIGLSGPYPGPDFAWGQLATAIALLTAGFILVIVGRRAA